MLKVLLVNKLFEPVVGGVETVVGQIATAFGTDSNFKVTVLAGHEEPFSGTKMYTWNGATVIKASSFGIKYNTAFSFSYAGLLSKLVKQHDVIHFHTPNPLGELSFFFTRVPAGKKVIVTVHADVSQTKRKKYAGISNFFLRRLLNRADIITTTTPRNLECFPVLQAFKSKCKVVPLAYNAEHMMPVSIGEKTAFCKKHGLDPQVPVILFVGRLSQEKGLAYLVNAMKYLETKAQLMIAGDGNLKAELETRAAALKGKKIVFTGQISHHELACAFSIATVFVLPSLNETFGIVQAEAMHCGIPVINTNLNTGVNFVSIHNQTGITVPPADATGLANAIDLILKDPLLREKFSSNAKKRAMLFTPEKMTAAFKAVYSGM